jgi:hypothetical protein
MVKVSRHDSHGPISPNQQHGNGTKVLLVQIEQIEIGAGQFPQGPPQQKT